MSAEDTPGVTRIDVAKGATAAAADAGAEKKKKPAAPPPHHMAKVVTALRRFAISITIFNILGYTVLGFEQAWSWPLIAVATAYVLDLSLEAINARVEGRVARFRGNGVRGVVEFLFPAHITALAVNMLTFPNDQLWVMLLGVVIGVGAKWVLRAPVKGRLRHFMNPSNFGIMMILVLFPWASIAPPYHFTDHVHGFWDWFIPVIIVASGTLLNAKLTGRMWLILGWLSFFVIQSVVRGWIFDTAILGALGMMTGVAFVLYTNYMVTDPGTTPSKPLSQFAFGAGVAITYGVLTAAHIAYGLFFATAIVCGIRGVFLWSLHIVEKQRQLDANRPAAPVAVPAPVAEKDGEKTGETPAAPAVAPGIAA